MKDSTKWFIANLISIAVLALLIPSTSGLHFLGIILCLMVVLLTIGMEYQSRTIEKFAEQGMYLKEEGK